MADVSLEAVEVPADAIVRGGANALEQMHRQAAVLAAVETVGAMDALLTMTVEYAKDRIAFGRPIGSFQALKHLMADLAMSLEVAKAAAAAAHSTVGQDRDDDATSGGRRVWKECGHTCRARGSPNPYNKTK